MPAVISDLDIYRAANLLIRQHSQKAEIEATRKADLMLDRGDVEGRRVWVRIKLAILGLQAPDRVVAAKRIVMLTRHPQPRLTLPPF
jgi:hypothetical protein